MDSKYCSACIFKLPLSSFLANASAELGSKVFKTCITCWDKSKLKRKALQLLDPNVPYKKRATVSTRLKPLILRLEPTIPPPNPLELRLEPLILLPNIPLLRPKPTIPPNPRPEPNLPLLRLEPLIQAPTIPPNPRLEPNLLLLQPTSIRAPMLPVQP